MGGGESVLILFFRRLFLAALLDTLGTGIEGTFAAGLFGEFFAGFLVCLGGGGVLALRFRWASVIKGSKR